MNIIKLGTLFCCITFTLTPAAYKPLQRRKTLKTKPKKHNQHRRPLRSPKIPKFDNETAMLEQELRHFFSTEVKNIGNEFRKSLKSDLFQSEVKKRKQRAEEQAKKSLQKQQQRKQRKEPASGRSFFDRRFPPHEAAGYPPARGGGYGGGYGSFGGGKTPSFFDRARPTPSFASKTPTGISSKMNISDSKSDAELKDEKGAKTIWPSGGGDSGDKDTKVSRQTALSKQSEIHKTMKDLSKETQSATGSAKETAYAKVASALPELKKNIDAMNESFAMLGPQEKEKNKKKNRKVYKNFFSTLMGTLPHLVAGSGTTEAGRDQVFSAVYRELEEAIDNPFINSQLSAFERSIDEKYKESKIEAKEIQERINRMKRMLPELQFEAVNKWLPKRVQKQEEDKPKDAAAK